MRTPTPDEPLQGVPPEAPVPADEPLEVELLELGPVSATEGGILGYKEDTGIGWQYY